MNARMTHEFRGAFDDHGGGHLLLRKSTPHIVGRVYAEGVDTSFAELGTNRTAQYPIARNDEYEWHPLPEV